MRLLHLIFIKILRFLYDFSNFIIGPRKQPSLKIEDFIIAPEIKIRIYKPDIKKPLPVIIFYHGGGWVIGSIKAYDRILQYLSHQSLCIFVAVEYRKSPEYKFPTAMNDCYFSYLWVLKNIDLIGGNKNKLGLMGDSAGGNIAAIITSKENVRANYLVLIYPVIDVYEKTLYQLKTEKKWVQKYGYKVLKYCLKQYLSNVKELDFISCPKISCAKVLIIAAENDVLSPAVYAYMLTLKKAGLDVIYKCYAKTFHGFINFAGISSKGKKALDDTVEFLKACNESAT